jgi:hypothetical protein
MTDNQKPRYQGRCLRATRIPFGVVCALRARSSERKPRGGFLGASHVPPPGLRQNPNPKLIRTSGQPSNRFLPECRQQRRRPGPRRRRMVARSSDFIGPAAQGSNRKPELYQGFQPIRPKPRYSCKHTRQERLLLQGGEVLESQLQAAAPSCYALGSLCGSALHHPPRGCCRIDNDLLFLSLRP